MRRLMAGLGISLVCTTAFAQYKADLPLPKGTEIVVDTYDNKTKTFAVFSARFPCEGYSYATPESLASVITDVNLNQILRDPKILAGKHFSTTAQLATVTDPEIERNHDGKNLDKVCSGK